MALPGLKISAIIMGFPESQHETHLPTFQSAPRAYARLPGPHEDPWRPRRHQRTPRQGPQAPGRLKLLPQPRGCSVQRLKTRAQFQAVLAGATISRTAHFALHRTGLDTQPPQSTAPGPESSKSQALFAVMEPWVGALIPKRWA